MKLDVTVQRQSKIIIGISVVVIASFVVAFALAVGGLCLHPLKDSQMIGAGLESSDDLGNEHLVPVALKYEIGGLSTEAGEIELMSFNNPYFDEFGNQIEDLPLCITNDMAKLWDFTLRVKGGYTPEDTLGFWPELGITFWQDQDKVDGAEMIQGWNIEYGEPVKDETCDCCNCYIWVGTPAWCGNEVCLVSNRYPTLMGGLEAYTSSCPEDLTGFIPGKEVTIKIGLLFSGCPLGPQQFAYILAQKKM